MRPNVCSAISTILISFAVGGPASAMMCNDPNVSPNYELKTLYEYAQIAEVPKNRGLNHMEDCFDSEGKMIAQRPTGIVELIVPREFTDLVAELVIAQNERAMLRPTSRDGDGRTPFTVGCRSDNRDWGILIDLSFKLLAIPRDQGVSFYLAGTEARGTVVAGEAGEPITVLGGTDLSKIPEIRANFEGESCVFPLVKTTVEVLCNALRYQRGKAYDALFEANSNNEVFSLKPQSLIMVGHSLGGSATQYVASNFPEDCKPEEGVDFSFEAYAFASPGLTNQRSTSLQSNTLHGFLINGDWVLRRAFHDRFQIGRIAVFRPPADSRMFCPGHTIDEVQAGICSCLKGEGVIRHFPGGIENSKIGTEQRCESDTDLNSSP